MEEEIINNLISEYCELFCKVLDDNYYWCIKNYKKDDILRNLDTLIINSDKTKKIMFIEAKKWLIEGFEKGEKKYLKNSYDAINHLINE